MSDNRNVSISNAKILFRNFSGKEGRYNPAGRRNFTVLLSHDMAEKLERDGWNVRYLEPRDDTSDVQPCLQVSVRYDNYPPKIALVTSHGISILDEETVGTLDLAEIENVDLTISPYKWSVGDKTGIKAFAKTMYVTIAEDPWESKYYNSPDSAKDSIGGCGHCEECDGHCGGGFASNV